MTSSDLRVTEILADFVVSTQPSAIPSNVRHAGMSGILNSIGCMLGGCTDEAMAIAVRTLSPFFGPAQAHVVGRAEQPDLLNAAFLNGLTSNVLEYDDTHFPTVIHPAAAVVPAALAMAERQGASGAAVLHSVTLGIEVSCRLGNSVIPDHYRRGWHITATCGIFGAAAAAGKLLGLDRQHMAWALGHAATQSAGLVESIGSMSKSIGVGNAARNGLAAALFAEHGFTAAPRAIEGQYGFAHAASQTVDFDAISRGLGKAWEVLANCHKPYPCGVVLFPVLDACLDLYQRHHPEPDHIERITVRGHPLLRERTDRPAPENGRTAKVSLQHSAAAAFVQGAAGLAQYQDACVADPAVRALSARVAVEEDETMPVEAAIVTMQLRDGQTWREEVKGGRGTPARPMTDAELDAKVRELAAFGAPHVDVATLIAAIRGIEAVPDISRIVQLTLPN
jgi:2-methylcitrate dehydratase PrpD